MGLMLFLADGDSGRAAAFLEVVQRRIPRDRLAWNDPASVQVQLDALKLALSATPEELDLAFRAWWKSEAEQPEDK
jgi:hypothetical protein